MNKIYFKTLLTACLLAYASLAFTQAKKPTIMVLPSDVWCNDNGYMMEFDNQGTKTKIPDYKRAFQENADLLLVISTINGLMADRGFPLKNAESTIKSLSSESAEDAMLQSKSGGNVSESPIDKLKKTAKADIIMQLTYKVNVTGPNRSVTFNLQGLDAYTDKQIATATGTGAPSFSAELPVLLKAAVLSHIDNFNASLQSYFDDLFANGREITIRIKKFDTWDGDLEKEYDGKELGSYIEDWLVKNTVKGRFSTTDATENMMFFEQVRIPLYDESGRAIDARGFAKGLQSYLKNPPFSIVNKLMTKGLGQATIVLGEK
jgi:hypothetical protein